MKSRKTIRKFRRTELKDACFQTKVSIKCMAQYRQKTYAIDILEHERKQKTSSEIFKSRTGRQYNQNSKENAFKSTALDLSSFN